MKWLGKRTHEGESPKPETEQANLERIQARRPEVERLIRAMRTEREKNHFGESVQLIFQGRRTS